MRYRYFLIAVPFLTVATAAQTAVAIPAFEKVFKKDYLDNNPHKEFAEEASKSPNKCLICHQGKHRKNRNAFGQELSKLLDKKKDAKNVEKISASIKKVLEMHIDPKDDKSPTYLDRLKEGKYPAGDLEELKKEPPKESADKEKEKE